MNVDTAPLGAEGFRRFLELRRDAIDHVAGRFQDIGDPASERRFGARGREACLEDLAFHLEFLRPVVEFGLVQPMVDYLRWCTGVLVTRGVPADRLSTMLDWLAEFFAARMNGEDGRNVVAALRETKARFVAPADATLFSRKFTPEPWPDCDAFESAALAGDRIRAGNILERCIAQGSSLVDVEEHIIRPALYSIGKRWQSNQISVAQEHLATAIAQSLMTGQLLKCTVPASNGRSVLLACVEGNMHSVGAQMVADGFVLAGWSVQYLGASVPTNALLRHVEEYRPDLLGLSVAFPQHLHVVKEIVSGLMQSPSGTRPSVMIGGLAVNQYNVLAGDLGADSWSPNACDAVTSIAQIAVPVGGR